MFCRGLPPDSCEQSRYSTSFVREKVPATEMVSRRRARPPPHRPPRAARSAGAAAAGRVADRWRHGPAGQRSGAAAPHTSHRIFARRTACQLVAGPARRRGEGLAALPTRGGGGRGVKGCVRHRRLSSASSASRGRRDRGAWRGAGRTERTMGAAHPRCAPLRTGAAHPPLVFFVEQSNGRTRAPHPHPPLPSTIPLPSVRGQNQLSMPPGAAPRKNWSVACTVDQSPSGEPLLHSSLTGSGPPRRPFAVAPRRFWRGPLPPHLTNTKADKVNAYRTSGGEGGRSPTFADPPRPTATSQPTAFPPQLTLLSQITPPPLPPHLPTAAKKHSPARSPGVPWHPPPPVRRRWGRQCWRPRR